MHPTTYHGLDKESTKVEGTQYRAMIDSLPYVTGFRPDTMFSVSLCVGFQKEPREVHLFAIKHIFSYLIQTSNLGLMFKRSESFRLTSYYDPDYVGDKVKRKSKSQSRHFIGGNLVTWLCKKQGSTALFTTEAEYMSVTSCA